MWKETSPLLLRKEKLMRKRAFGRVSLSEHQPPQKRIYSALDPVPIPDKLVKESQLCGVTNRVKWVCLF